MQDLLGHADLSSTMLYTHVNPAALRAKVQGKPEEELSLEQQVAALREQVAALQKQIG